MDKRYASADWFKMKSGLPALRDAIVSFGCEIVDIHRVGTHNILMGRVIDLRQRHDGDALLYFDRQYLNLPSNTGSFGG
jgi:flavin reductase